MNITDRTSGISGMNKLLWFMTNYDWENVSYEIPWSGEIVTEWLPKFIGRIEWGCNIAHIIKKWKSVFSAYSSSDSILYFYFALDNENSKKVLNYIIDNYNNERNII